MLESQEKTSNIRTKLVFPENSVDGLTGKLHVTFTINTEHTEEEDDIRGSTHKEDIMLSYHFKGSRKYLGFKRKKWSDGDEIFEYDGIHPVFMPHQDELDKEVYNFLKENLPEEMKAVLPEQK